MYKGILDGVGGLLNKLDEPIFIGGRRRQTVHVVDAHIKIFRSIELEMNLSCGCLLCCYLFCLFHLSPIRSHLSTLCHFNSGEVYSGSWIRVPPGGGVLIFQFYLLLPPMKIGSYNLFNNHPTPSRMPLYTLEKNWPNCLIKEGVQ